MGIGDGVGVGDHQISSPNPYYVDTLFAPGHRSRLGLTESTDRMAPYWRPGSDVDSSLEVDLLVTHTLTALVTEGCVESWVTSASLYISDDRVTWESLGVRKPWQDLWVKTF